jgi:carbon-monoxide dehydrogenase iron sulfur subunit
MAAAISVEFETGRVLFDRDRCVGCKMCVMVCPHQAITPDPTAGKAIICDQCEGRERPVCVAACSTGAIVYIETSELETNE